MQLAMARARDTLTLLLILGATLHGAAQESTAPLENTRWQLVKFQRGRDPALTPDDPSKYVVQFGTGGEVTVRIDCNRGRGKWTLSAGNRLQLSPLALTRAKCPYGSLHDTLVKYWTEVQSMTLKNGHLILSLRNPTGAYEFAKAPTGR